MICHSVVLMERHSGNAHALIIVIDIAVLSLELCEIIVSCIHLAIVVSRLRPIIIFCLSALEVPKVLSCAFESLPLGRSLFRDYKNVAFLACSALPAEELGIKTSHPACLFTFRCDFGWTLKIYLLTGVDVSAASFTNPNLNKLKRWRLVMIHKIRAGWKIVHLRIGVSFLVCSLHVFHFSQIYVPFAALERELLLNVRFRLVDLFLYSNDIIGRTVPSILDQIRLWKSHLLFLLDLLGCLLLFFCSLGNLLLFSCASIAFLVHRVMTTVEFAGVKWI